MSAYSIKWPNMFEYVVWNPNQCNNLNNRSTTSHRRLFDGSSRQLALPSATGQGDPLLLQHGQNSDKSSTNNQASSTLASISNVSSSSQLNIISQSGTNTTLLASATPSSCLIMRRPSANMYFFHYFIFHFTRSIQIYTASNIYVCMIRIDYFEILLLFFQ